jgi:ankyrin repeat protein
VQRTPFFEQAVCPLFLVGSRQFPMAMTATAELGLGADPNIRSEWGATPLDSARQHGREAVGELLEPLTGSA